MTDLRLAIRSLARAPIFAATAILTIALGVGATTAVFSVVYGVLYRPLPYPRADRLVAIWATKAPDPSIGARAAARVFVGTSLLNAWRRDVRCFEDIAGFRPNRFTLTGSGEPVRVEGAVATASFFNVLGQRPFLGRLFQVGEDEPGRDEVVVLGYAFWKEHFGGDRNVVGSTVRLDGLPHTIIGVLPEDARFPLQYTDRQPPLYTPMSHEFTPKARFSVLLCVARLKAGKTVAAAQAEMTAAMRHLAATTMPNYRGRGAWVTPLAGQSVDTMQGTERGLLILWGATFCVLLIGCVNVANLLLVRAAARHRELAIRAALGAGRWRVVRQVIVESLTLSTAGGLAGVLVAAWGSDLLVALMPRGLFPRIEDVHLDLPVLVFAVAASLVAGLLASLTPAWDALRRDSSGRLAEALKEGHRAGTGGQGARLLRRGLVTAEVVLAMVLLVGAGLLTRTYAGLMQVDLGVRPEHTLTFGLDLPAARYAAPGARLAFIAEVLARLRAIGGAQATGATDALPVLSWLPQAGIAIDGQALADDGPTVSRTAVSDGFFEAAGVALVSGRLFNARDVQPDVAIVNRAFVRRFWPNASRDGGDALGRIIRLPDGTRRIVGVVGDVRYRGPDGDLSPIVYVPFSSSPGERLAIVLRSANDPTRLATAVRAAVHAADADLPLDDLQTLEHTLAEVVAPQRFRVAVIGAFAVLALALAVVGLYGVVAQSVTQRTQEIGIRLALGAGRGRIIRLVLNEALLMVGLGIVGGVTASVAATRTLASFLFGVTPTDVATYTVVALTMVVVGTLACVMPARHASAIDPVVALRDEG